VLIVGALISTSLASFWLGSLTANDAGKGVGTSATTATDTTVDTSVVASKYGTKYYLPSCAGASRITTANRVSFASAAEARAAGYTPATNCVGL